ncbi:MAG: histidine triad nucleotide-binding protein [Verrucomicrobiota bacterium]|nr:histidine triad nucleotide-binding protein [Verrucomicrobiota bacterium]
MSDSIFTKIINREIPSPFIHEDDHCIAIKDLHPQALGHYLVIPKKQITRLAEATPEDHALLGHLLLSAQRVAKKEGLEEGGYRIVINSGPNAGETVPHLHVHILGGERLKDSFGA